MGDTKQQTQRDLLQDPPSWDEIFPFDSPYDHQKSAIEDTLSVCERSGFSVIEGGCGTGKTLIGLTTAGQLIRNPRTKYNRALILTSVKQQLRQFEDDLREVNANMPDDIPKLKGLSLQGKVDLCPYNLTDTGGFDEPDVSCNARCQNLRSNTAKVSHNDASELKNLADEVEARSEEVVTLNGVETPFKRDMPYDSGTEFCPFYSRIKARDGKPQVAFSHAPDHVLDVDALTKTAGANGECPHSAMSTMMMDAEVVMANYSHAFDRGTLMLTNHIIDDTTLVICDEAHMLEPRVRSILSQDVTLGELHFARQEVAQLLSALGSRSATTGVVERPHSEFYADVRETAQSKKPIGKKRAKGAITENGLTQDHLEYAFEFLTDLYQVVRATVPDLLDEEHSNWRNNIPGLNDQIELALREPTRTMPDMITRWFKKERYPDSAWSNMAQIAELTGEAAQPFQSGGDPALVAVSELLHEWGERGHDDHFRQIKLEKERRHQFDDWRDSFKATLSVKNCMPRAAICSRLDSFGGGILMSATLEPLDVYKELTGIEYLSEHRHRPVITRTYQSDYPDENNDSLIVPATRFTASNRESPGSNSETRQEYKRIMTAVDQTPGNILVTMPSYGEAEWAGSVMDELSEKDVLIDEPSTESETQQLKQEFIEGPGKIMCTSLRGTLIEGVDYDGDKLHAVLVCGLPLPNMGSPTVKAIKNAYTEQYGEPKGFQYGMAVPAVRKTRQAIGRVIRTSEDIGVRVVVDERYDKQDGYTSAGSFLGPEREEFEVVGPVGAEQRIQEFWAQNP